MSNEPGGESPTPQGDNGNNKAKEFRKRFIATAKKREPGKTGGLPPKNEFLETIVEGTHGIDTSKYKKPKPPKEKQEGQNSP